MKVKTAIGTRYISVSDLRSMSLTKILYFAQGRPVAILNQNIPEAYLLTAQTYEQILKLLDDPTRYPDKNHHRLGYFDR
jgi:PHD/YefM family antitoxin component YafN of YafNO toxin-antitoxin module